MSRRSVALAAGVAAFVLAVAAMVGVAALSVQRVVVAFVGVAALLQAVRVARRRRGTLDRAEMPNPDRRVRVGTPGESVEDALDEFTAVTDRQADQPTRFQRALHRATVAVLARYGGLSEVEADRQVADGSWTDDPDAAAFLADRDRRRGIGERLRAAAGGESGFDRGVRRVVDELAAIAGVAGTAEPVKEPDAPGRTAADGESAGVRDSRETGHWAGVSAVALLAVGVGVLARSPAALLAGVVGVGYAGVAQATAPPAPDLSVERSVSDENPVAGDDVTVSVAVTNDGDRAVSDLRLADGVPGRLTVADGSARLGTALRPGETATIEYTVEARPGVHEFDPLLAVARDAAGSHETEVLADAETTLTCVPPLRPPETAVPLRTGFARHAGRTETDVGGPGLEFRAVREYRPGDPMSRVDWKRYAKTGDLATVEFREERAARVVVVVDARAEVYLAPTPDADHAVERSADAARALVAGLLDAGDRAGVTAFAPNEPWLSPGAGVTHRTHARRLLATDSAFAPLPPTQPAHPWRLLQRLRRQLPAGTQVLLCSPLADHWAARVACRLDAAGHPVTVVSPDPTAARTREQRLARVARKLRLGSLRDAGIHAVDWPADEPLAAALRRGERRWSP